MIHQSLLNLVQKRFPESCKKYGAPAVLEKLRYLGLSL